MKIEYPIRLQSYLAKCGAGSRRSCETLITEGRVTVNNKIVTELGTKVNENDIVYVDDVLAEPEEQSYYFVLNKPRGYVCTNYDPNETAYARDLIDIPQRNLLFNVGRLDKDSQGLIIFTNDGDFANLVMHPSSETEKEYIVKVDQDIIKKDMDDAYRGLIQPYRIKSYKLLSKREVSVVLTEGKNREIRNLFDMMGYEVKKLTRIRIGDVLLGDLQSGKYRRMSRQEIQSLLKRGKKA
ncbi:MAG: rRNA pseudouridine synthase [Spirochaetales bacterium]|jgi:23S rRNA pseudouridine2605 synthase|nr:rRNA pseudouridine synthase [Spirochaetales bacterium]MBQ3727982.1 rRNA pseudouridine synthase [Spirochaetales bacterium]MBQ3830537.1 rRNA pseudouridine synthase [Spirochaetales bacterium]MBQ4281990.1 rRNA pseudouridine synthase [Spirochaetales bacterium]MBQ4500614.1 rRNA pseudouridine synthase [Spirochaetales bacterium]